MKRVNDGVIIDGVNRFKQRNKTKIDAEINGHFNKKKKLIPSEPPLDYKFNLFSHLFASHLIVSVEWSTTPMMHVKSLRHSAIRSLRYTQRLISFLYLI